jgi:hypothetical protein
VRFAGHIVHSGVSGARNINAIFFILGWDRYGFDKKHAEASYTKIVFLHPVGSVGHLVLSVASGTRNVNTLFSCSGGTKLDLRKSALGHVTPNMCSCIRWNLWVM